MSIENKENNPKNLGHFRSLAGEQSYKQSYETAMQTLPTPLRTIDVETDYGTVRAYEFGSQTTNKELAPIVLLPGRASGVPMWGKNLSELAVERTVYALDAIGDAGLSVQTHVLKDASDQAKWLEQVFQELRLTRIHLVGHSFGGWLAANYAARYPDRVATLNVLEPVFVFQGLRWQVYLQATLAILPFLPQSLRDKMLSDIGGGAKVDRTDPIAHMIADASSFFNTRVPQPTQITEDQLLSLTMPVYAAIGGKSGMHDPEAAAAVAKKINGSEVKIWPDGTHSLPMEFATEINHALLDFMNRHGSTSPE